jgi:hypothetical protein
VAWRQLDRRRRGTVVPHRVAQGTRPRRRMASTQGIDACNELALFVMCESHMRSAAASVWGERHTACWPRRTLTSSHAHFSTASELAQRHTHTHIHSITHTIVTIRWRACPRRRAREMLGLVAVHGERTWTDASHASPHREKRPLTIVHSFCNTGCVS